VADRRKEAAVSERTLREYEAETTLNMEKKRAELVEVKNSNLVAEATAEAEATEKRMASLKNVDSQTLLALAIQKMAESGHIGQVNLTSELLAALQKPNGNK